MASLRIETGKYVNLEVGDRTCPFCGKVEDEKHVILECNVYTDLREWLFSRAESVCPNFINLSGNDKFILLFKHNDLVRACAKTCFNILQRRNSLLFR